MRLRRTHNTVVPSTRPLTPDQEELPHVGKRTIEGMRRFRELPALGVLLVALAGVCAYPISAQAVPSSGKQEHTRQWLNPVQESTINQLFSPPPNSPGDAIALIKDDEFVFAKGQPF